MGIQRLEFQNPKQQVHVQASFNLNSDFRSEVISILNTTLADEAVLITKTRSALWNVSGPGFSEWRMLFEDQAKQIDSISAEISKRTWVLGGRPIASLDEFIKISRIKEIPRNHPDFMDLVNAQDEIIRYLTEDAKKCTGMYEDAVTCDFLLKILFRHEKMVWALRSELKNEPNRGQQILEVPQNELSTSRE
jgi:starvation-inducible DNA-binding protein